jgi:ABC-type transporter Mla maintaining outer membrane lipid asymmetry ATPase subunit MlaF
MTAKPLSVRDLPLGTSPIKFDLRGGEILAVLGGNGSGKSLLLAHLTGHLRAPAGCVSVGGWDLFLRSQRRSAQAELGVVFQYPALIRNMTVFENVALPFLAHGLDLDGALEDRVMLRLRLVGCERLASEAVDRISEGDKRCVALARALAGQPRLLITDEPTAALAPARCIRVEELMRTLVQTGALGAIVLATQDLEFAWRMATYFLLLHDRGHTFMRREDAAQNEQFKSFTTQTT